MATSRSKSIGEKSFKLQVVRPHATGTVVNVRLPELRFLSRLGISGTRTPRHIGPPPHVRRPVIET